MNKPIAFILTQNGCENCITVKQQLLRDGYAVTEIDVFEYEEHEDHKSIKAGLCYYENKIPLVKLPGKDWELFTPSAQEEST